MRAHTGVRDVRGYSEIRKPQILYICVTESLLYRLVKIFTGEHRSHWISQVHNLPPPLHHFLPADINTVFLDANISRFDDDKDFKEIIKTREK